MRAYKLWINQSFNRRISAFFIPVILILLVTVGGISYYIYYSSILKETEQNIIGIVEQRNYTADLYFQDVKSTIVTLMDNEDITYMLKNYTFSPTKSWILGLQEYRKPLLPPMSLKKYI